jgi:hypothetical protein
MIDDKGNKLQYTAPQRKRESKEKTNQRILLVEKKRNNIIEKKLIYSFKIANQLIMKSSKSI